MIAAILLAAGESRRMGVSKPLLDWAGETLIEYQVHQLCDGGVDNVIAVLGHHANEVRPLAERAGASVVVNDRYAEGRASSLRAGATAIPPGAAEIAVLNVDQPRPASVTSRLLAEHLARAALITLPTYDGKRGHPAFLCGSLLPELCTADDATKGLRAVIHRRAADVREVVFNTPIVLLDINTQADYERAVVLSFIDCINRGDVAGLGRRMTDDHQLQVFAEPPLAGREANIAAWHSYLESFARYTIYPHRLAEASGQVAVLGHTTGSHLNLPDAEETKLTLIWLAEVAGGHVRSWTLIEDTPDNRQRRGLD